MTDTATPPPVVARPGQAYESTVLRWAGAADAASLSALWRQAYPEDDPDVRPWLDHGGVLTLQDRAGRVLAALRWREDGSGWRVDRVATRPEARGLGYGRWLATQIEALAIRRNVPYLELRLPADAREQRAYYERMGYRPVPERADDGREAARADAGAGAVAVAGAILMRKQVGGVWQRKAIGPNGRAPRHGGAA